MHTGTSNITGRAGIQKAMPWGYSTRGKRITATENYTRLEKYSPWPKLQLNQYKTATLVHSCIKTKRPDFFHPNWKSTIIVWWLSVLALFLGLSGQYTTPEPILIYIHDLQFRIRCFHPNLYLARILKWHSVLAIVWDTVSSMLRRYFMLEIIWSGYSGQFFMMEYMLEIILIQIYPLCFNCSSLLQYAFDTQTVQ